MPTIIEPGSSTRLSFEELVAHCEENIDFEDSESILSLAPQLHSLQNDREFLAMRINSELRVLANVQSGNLYSHQVFFLGNFKNFFVRANFWPGEKDAVLAASGARAFFYGYPHDHNFDFITVGYHGPGYVSEFYEYDYDSVVGYPGEKVDLVYKCTESLDQGKVIFYRRSKDIHNQLPGKTFSISLNVCANLTRDAKHVDQYLFDLEKSVVVRKLNRNALPIILSAAAHIGNGDSCDLLVDISKKHHQPATRLAATMALSTLLPEDRERFLREAANDRSKKVSFEAAKLLSVAG